ncbi:hypothetical protein DM2_2328 [Halorubrum sp. DM2]|nr:hypothetical protein DM2_2328 [Halorubrum sp. DM2]
MCEDFVEFVCGSIADLLPESLVYYREGRCPEVILLGCFESGVELTVN